MRTEMELDQLSNFMASATTPGATLGVSETDPRNTEFEEPSEAGADKESQPRQGIELLQK
ncbi:MAG: hypothetical protein R3193_11220 [Marinobacter sp.]|nr:hypothetical protein [Marinobacter sp.]